MKRTHIAFLLVLPTGCAGLVGVPDLTYESGQAAEAGASDAAFERSSPADGAPIDIDTGVNDASADAPSTCAATVDLSKDGQNCGRCGHDCLGGQCGGGQCAPKLLSGQMSGAEQLLVTGTDIFITNYGNGSVIRVGKTNQTASPIVSGQGSPQGLATDGTNLFWANEDFAGDGTGTDPSWGGIWACTLPACTTSRLIRQGDQPASLAYSAGFLYYVEHNGFTVDQVKPDGTMFKTLASPTQPFAVGVDSSNVYYSTNNGNLDRVALTGGTEQTMGPYEIGAIHGLIALDADRVYWAYTSDNGTGHVYSAPKTAGALTTPRSTLRTPARGRTTRTTETVKSSPARKPVVTRRARSFSPKASARRGGSRSTGTLSTSSPKGRRSIPAMESSIGSPSRSAGRRPDGVHRPERGTIGA
jgi:hypothetical protein